MNSNYSIMEIGTFNNLAKQGRLMIGKDLNLTGCEISANSLPADQAIPFLHSHKQNEEVYIIISGTGEFIVDDSQFPIKEGSMIRVDPSGRRTLRAGKEGLVYLCLQVQQNSLKQATETDGVILDSPITWA